MALVTVTFQPPAIHQKVTSTFHSNDFISSILDFAVDINSSVVAMEVLISPQPVTQHLLQPGSPRPLPQPVTVTLRHPAIGRELTTTFSSDVMISEVMKVAEVCNSSIIGMEVRNVSQPPASLPLPVSQAPVSLSQPPPPLPQPASPPTPLPQPMSAPSLLQPVSQSPASLLNIHPPVCQPLVILPPLVSQLASPEPLPQQVLTPIFTARITVQVFLVPHPAQDFQKQFHVEVPFSFTVGDLKKLISQREAISVSYMRLLETELKLRLWKDASPLTDWTSSNLLLVNVYYHDIVLHVKQNMKKRPIEVLVNLNDTIETLKEKVAEHPLRWTLALPEYIREVWLENSAGEAVKLADFNRLFELAKTYTGIILAPTTNNIVLPV